MARCTLHLELERGRTAYRAGETVRGTVEVRSEAPVACSGLTVQAVWGTSLRSTQGRSEELTLFRGEWPAHAVARYPFAIALPRAPLSYRGELIDVLWRIETRARVPGFDSKSMAEIQVVADPEAEPDWANLYQPSSAMHHLGQEVLAAERPEAASPPGPGLPRALKIGCVALVLVPLVLLGLVLVGGLASAAGDFGAVETVAVLVVAGIIFAVIGRWIWRNLLGNRVAERRLGPVHLEVTPALARGGKEVAVRVSFMPRRRVTVEGIRAILEAKEIYVLRGERRPIEKTHTVERREVELSPRRELGAGHPLQVEGAVRIPDGAPPSFAVHDNMELQLTWRLAVRVAVRGGIDWEDSRLLLVHP